MGWVTQAWLELSQAVLATGWDDWTRSKPMMEQARGPSANTTRATAMMDWAGLVALILPAIMVAVRMSAGISLSPDSLVYLYAARHFFEVGGPITYDGSALTTFPPLYPLLVALANMFVAVPEQAASVIAVVSMAGCSGVAYALLRQLDFQRLTALALVLLVFLHPHMQTVFWYAWSEGPYILISELVLLLLMRTPAHLLQTSAIVVGVLAGVGFLTRYAGVVLLPTIAVGMLCVSQAPLRSRVRALVLAASAGSLMVGLWLLRNRLIDGSVLGHRPDSVDTWRTTIGHLASTMGSWLVPVGKFSVLAYVGLFGLFAMTLLILVACRAAFRNEWRLLPALTFVLAHVGLLVYSQLKTTLDPIGFRLMSPAAAPALLVLAWSVRYLWLKTRRSSRIPAALAWPAVAVIVAYTACSIRLIGDPPWGYAAYRLAARDVPGYCLAPGRHVFASAPNFLRYRGIAPNALALPRGEIYRTDMRQDDWGEFIAALTQGDACLVWLGAPDGDKTPSPAELLGGDPGPVAIALLAEQGGIFYFRATLPNADRQAR